jgi:hypothetical protein
MIVHYRQNQAEKRAAYRSTADFTEGALCGNGTPLKHLLHTRDKSRVTCPACRKALGLKIEVAA